MKCTTHTHTHTHMVKYACHCDEGSLIGDAPANEYFHTYIFQERYYVFLVFTKVAIFILRALPISSGGTKRCPSIKSSVLLLDN